MQGWEELIEIFDSRTAVVNIAVVGKYVRLTDSYKSLNEALEHGGLFNNTRVNRVYVDAEELMQGDDVSRYFEDIHGILMPGGFGERGIEGKIRAAEYARTKKIPYFGICLGMQLAVVEFARNVSGLKSANSSEFDQHTPDAVIDFLPDQRFVTKKGGTMRLGAYRCILQPGTNAMEAYKSREISERHRHRYEFNNNYEKKLTGKGLIISGRNPETGLAEIIEIPDHPWFLGCQFHPEFKSKPMQPHPLFRDFISASCAYRDHPK